MKTKTLKLQPHSASKLHLVCVENTEAIDQYVADNEINMPEDISEPEGLFVKQGNEFYIIFHQNTSHGDIAHEVVHFLNTLYKAIGQQLDEMNDELYAHLLSTYTDKAIKLQQKEL
jgi:hypothetical protein